MSRYYCDRCGCLIEKRAVRYIAKIEVTAASDPLEITGEDLMRDRQNEIEDIVRQCEDMTEEELMRGVYVKFEFDLCSRCQKGFVSDPLHARI